MVTPELNADGYTGNILIEPNRPISWQDNIRFIRVFALISVLVGISFIFNGMILVLPFSGLEVACLYLALYFVYKHYSVCQVLYFTKDSVIIESGTDHATERVEYQRFWSKFHVDKQGSYNIPRLMICSKGKCSEIGQFLSYADKLTLIKLVKEITLHFQQTNDTLLKH